MGSSTLQFSGVNTFNWDTLAAQQRAEVDAANIAQGGPELDFSGDSGDSADTYRMLDQYDADQTEARRAKYDQIMGAGSNPMYRPQGEVYGAGQNTWYGQGSPSYSGMTGGDWGALQYGNQYAPDGGPRFSNPTMAPPSIPVWGGTGGATVPSGSRTVGGGGGGIQQMPTQGVGGTVGVGTGYRDQVSMPAAPTFESPAPYNPRAPETVIYDKLKELVTNPNAFLNDDVYKMLLAQGEQALGRSTGAKRMRFAGKTLDDFQTLGQRTAGGYYQNRINQLLGGSAEERNRYTAQEGAERAAWGANAGTTMARNQQAMDAWRGNMATYGSRLEDAWRRDVQDAQTKYNRNMEAGLINSPMYRSSDPQQAVNNLNSWGMQPSASLIAQLPNTGHLTAWGTPIPGMGSGGYRMDQGWL